MKRPQYKIRVTTAAKLFYKKHLISTFTLNALINRFDNRLHNFTTVDCIFEQSNPDEYLLSIKGFGRECRRQFFNAILKNKSKFDENTIKYVTDNLELKPREKKSNKQLFPDITKIEEINGRLFTFCMKTGHRLLLQPVRYKSSLIKDHDDTYDRKEGGRMVKVLKNQKNLPS